MNWSCAKTRLHNNIADIFSTITRKGQTLENRHSLFHFWEKDQCIIMVITATACLKSNQLQGRE